MPSPYVLLGEYIVALSFQLIALTIFTFLVFYTKKKKIKLNFPFHMYMKCCIILSICGIIVIAYLIAFWNHGIATYNSYVIYIFGTLTLLFLVSNAAFVSLLTIDRIFAVIYPTKYKKKHRRFAVYITTILLIAYSMALLYFDILPDFPRSSTTACRSFGCLISTTQLLMYMGTRYFLAAFNIVLGSILGLSIKLFVKNTTSHMNELIIITLTCSLLFDFIPHFTDFLVYVVSKIQCTFESTFSDTDSWPPNRIDGIDSLF